MKILGFEFGQKVQTFDFEVLRRIIAANDGTLSGMVTPDTCMQSPTVHAIVTAISRRISVSPIAIYKKSTKDGKEIKERLPNHPVAKLLNAPNKWQSRSDYWQDAASAFVRYGRYFAFKSRGTTGPIRELLPIKPSRVSIKQNDNWQVTYEVDGKEVPSSKIHYARGPARNFIQGDSPVDDVASSIALEILAEKLGISFFENGAIPLLVFEYAQGIGAFKNKDDEKKLIQDFQDNFSGKKRHRALLLPKGIEAKDPVRIEQDKAQMIETRRYQRTVIAGAFGVPPHLVGDLERATFNNVEQQDSDFTLNCIMPVVQAFESAMERDLLTTDDINSGVVIRFNLDSILRADFKSRQEGLQIQRNNGVISPDEWRELERMNPLPDGNGGDDYLRPANMVVAGAPIKKPVEESAILKDVP